MKLKLILVLFVALGCAQITHAQEGASYTNALGLRGGNYFGLSYKVAWKGNFAEVILSDFGRGIQLAGFYEIQGNTGLGKLDYYYGPGVHVGGSNGVVALGVDGIAGLEVQVFDLPLTAGIDIIPRLNLIERTDFDIGLGVHFRYIW